MQKRIKFGSILLLFWALACQPSPETTPPPNILFMMADDHTSQAFGIYGHFLDSIGLTSNIRQLAREGVRLDGLYCTNSICVPSRASILTGQYSHVNQVYTLSDSLATDRRHLGHLMQDAGYQTALIGKWHLRSQPQGFDFFRVLPGQGRYQNPILKSIGQEWKAPGDTFPGYSADVIGAESLRWLEQRDPQKPFMLLTHFKAVHEPFDYPARYAELYEGFEFPLPESFWEDLSHRSPATQQEGMFIRIQLQRYLNTPERYPPPALDVTGMSEKEQVEAAYQKMMRDYMRGVAALNDNIGRLLAWLEENDLADNTIVVYTSDQGYFLGEHGYKDKRLIYEESARMPAVIRYPGKLQANTYNQDLLLNSDIAPTLLDWAGVPIPEHMQGRSFAAVLAGQRPDDWRTSFYYRYWLQGNRPAHLGMRNERFKLIYFYSLPLDMTGTGNATAPGWELYDLEKDPQELHNVYQDPAYQALIPGLKAELDSLQQAAGDDPSRYPAVQSLRESLP
ncbi:MAG: sulfatase [Bacteroidota bacterium]